MSKYNDLKKLILKKFPNMSFIKRSDNLEMFWISCFDLVKIIETKDIPKLFISIYVNNGIKHYSSNNLLYFLRTSSNPHHTIDYLIPLGIEYVERPLLEIIKLFDKYGIRGKYNYNMNECSNCLNFIVSYYYHCPIPLLIDVYSTDQDPMRESLYKMFETQRCKCIEVDTREWVTMKDTILYNVESHLVKLHAINFMEKIIKESEEIKDVVDELGEDVVDACCSGNEFPFPLSECLKKFRITESNVKYQEIIKMFESNVETIDTHDECCIDNLDELDDLSLDISNIDELSEIATGGGSTNDNMSETSENDDNTYDCNIITQYNENTLYIEGIDYVYQNNDYYLNHPTLIKIAIRSGIRKAEQYVDMSWKLIQYINQYGKSAYESLLKTITMSVDERRQMFAITNKTLEQNLLTQLQNSQNKITELESYIDINKTKKNLEKYTKHKNIECEKNQIDLPSVLIQTPTREVFVVNEKKPTKVKPSSILQRGKGPIKSNELEIFLDLKECQT